MFLQHRHLAKWWHLKPGLRSLQSMAVLSRANRTMSLFVGLIKIKTYLAGRLMAASFKSQTPITTPSATTRTITTVPESKRASMAKREQLPRSLPMGLKLLIMLSKPLKSGARVTDQMQKTSQTEKFQRVTRSKALKAMISLAQSAIKERVAHALLLVLCKSSRLA